MFLATGCAAQKLGNSPRRSTAYVSLLREIVFHWHEGQVGRACLYRAVRGSRLQQDPRHIEDDSWLSCPSPHFRASVRQIYLLRKGAERARRFEGRVKRTAPSAKVAYILGDCNQHIDEILAAIPAHSPGHRVLSLCFVDPYDIGIKFETLSKLSNRFVDFLVLLALYMDANRNYENYMKEEAVKIDEFLGLPTWRERWKISLQNGTPFPQFLAEEFSKSMETLGYQPQPFYKMKQVKISEKNVRLYCLAFFSRNPRAYSFWDQVLKYRNPQTTFNFEEPLVP